MTNKANDSRRAMRQAESHIIRAKIALQDAWVVGMPKAHATLLRDISDILRDSQSVLQDVIAKTPRIAA